MRWQGRAGAFVLFLQAAFSCCAAGKTPFFAAAAAVRTDCRQFYFPYGKNLIFDAVKQVCLSFFP
ncbi:hypothetical protein HMPREF9120_00860 [Neisseria sp. oral taxon 020 str. F0370]|nr:hypothetical protein HMPREF9120_00860 [Neisseria sp. oral taxon 020 str. F0370]